jgi:hypothetical protein
MGQNICAYLRQYIGIVHSTGSESEQIVAIENAVNVCSIKCKVPFLVSYRLHCYKIDLFIRVLTVGHAVAEGLKLRHEIVLMQKQNG